MLHHVPPDGCTSLALVHGAGGARQVVLSGPWIESLAVPVMPGAWYWGLRFQPYGAAAALGIDPARLRNRSQPAAPLLGDLCAELLALDLPDQDIDALVPALDRILLARVGFWARPDPLVRAGVIALRATEGEVGIARLAAELGCSPRTLRRRFRNAAGQSPKEFARIVRLLRAARALLPGTTLGWATLAAESGYADQSHLVHEFRDLTGLTPEAFLERMRGTTHDL
jgi:AraC-like DNA-binding protein